MLYRRPEIPDMSPRVCNCQFRQGGVQLIQIIHNIKLKSMNLCLLNNVRRWLSDIQHLKESAKLIKPEKHLGKIL